MRTLLLALSALLCCSCATVKTISPENNHVVIEHRGKKSYCEEIPRVYSGISYNICLLYGEPSQRENVGGGINYVPWFVFDSAFSVVADTIVIPYTLVAQSTKGNIKVN
ncbi:MAG: YceK/YidQ family lipoprotein [Alteromonadaceae bacterium]|nr:YceK/YidQ family lipoprotein [Alteromonadaceae bacterium]